MAQLRIFMHRSGAAAMHSSGFSWSAAIAFPLWALTRRLYATAVTWCGCLVLLSLLVPRFFAGIEDEGRRIPAVFACLICYWLAPGFVAGWWHRRMLVRKGFFVSADEGSPSGTRR
jgi:hypothetical protein